MLWTSLITRFANETTHVYQYSKIKQTNLKEDQVQRGKARRAAGFSLRGQGLPPAGTRLLKVHEDFFILRFHNNFLDNDVISLKLKLDMTIV